MSRVPMLVATQGPLAGARYAITEEGILLGRDPTCAVAIPDTGVSRQHARVLLHIGDVWVQDAGSRNGVFVNSKRLTRPKSVGPGDEITVGAHAFTIEVVGSDDEHSVSRAAPPLPKLKPAPTAWIVGVTILAIVVGLLVYLLRD